MLKKAHCFARVMKEVLGLVLTFFIVTLLVQRFLK